MPEAAEVKPTPEQRMIDLRQILIPADRQRQKVTEAKLHELATSIQAHGLMSPIVVCPVDRVRFPDAPPQYVYQLVAGYRRFLAHAKLKRMQISAIMRDDVTDRLEQEEMELDENLLREQLPWQEEVAAKARIAAIRKAKYGDGIREVAEHINESRGETWEDIRLAQALQVLPELGDSKNKSQAQNKLRLLMRRQELSIKADELKKKGPVEDLTDYSHKIFLGNCLDIVKGWADGCLHCIITDPPYGINLDEGETKKGSPHPTIYHDNTYDIMDLTALAIKESYRLLREHTHAYFFFDIKAYPKVFKMLQDAGFTVEPIPLVWVKPGPGQVNHPDSRWGSGYEACFFVRKGNRALLKQGQSNVLHYDPVPTKQKIHPVEKPAALIRQLIETSTAPGEVIGDLFGGSGVLAEAAIQTGRNFLLCEKDEAYHAGILERIGKLTKGSGNNLGQRDEGNQANPKYDPLGGEEEE